MNSRQKWQAMQSEKKTEIFVIRLSPSMMQEIVSLSAKHRISRNAVISDLLSDALNLLQSEYKMNTDKSSLILLDNP